MPREAPTPQDAAPPGGGAAHPSEPPPGDWRAEPAAEGWELLLGLVFIWGSQQIIALAAHLLAGLPSGAEPEGNPVAIGIQTALAHAVTFATVWFLLCRKGGRSMKQAFAWKPVRPLAVLGCVALGAAAAAGVQLLGRLYDAPDTPMARMLSSPLGLAVMCPMAIAIVPFEEIYYRGFIFPALRKLLGAAGAVAVIAVWFGLAHAAQNWGDWAGIGIITLMGLVWTLQRHVSGSLLPGLVTHLAYNLTLIALMLASLC